MKAKSEYVSYVLNDLLSDFSGISSRNMFGGTAIYMNGRVFAMIVDDELYFKVGVHSVDMYKNAGSHPFTYIHHGKEIAMSYWLVPEFVLDNKQELQDWVKRALADQKK